MSTPDRLILPRPIYAEIVAHAQAGAPEEVCGILRGRGARATGLVRAGNVAENRVMDYQVDSQTLLKQFEFEEQGEEMIAIYHSHPVSEAYPSATDARNAHYPDATYLICSLAQPQQPILRGFRMTAERLAQRPAGVRPLRGASHFLARQQRDGSDDHYLLVFQESDEEHWRKVRIVEQEIVLD